MDILDHSILAGAQWHRSSDGFMLCLQPLSQLLQAHGIADTGISELNHRDVDSYFDDWHLYRVDRENTVWSLVKLREQEYDYVPGYADGDYPGVTISFIAFNIDTLLALPRGAGADAPEMAAFLESFRRVTDLPWQTHDPALQAYFGRDAAEAPYVIARQYICKLASLAKEGIISFPEGMTNPPRRITDGISRLNERAGRMICDFDNHCIRLADPENLTAEETCILLAAFCGNLSLNSFAAEVKFHADALISWENWIPILGKRKWYASAIRADMAVEHDGLLRRLLFDSYHNLHSRSVQRQRQIHGEM